MSTLSGTSRFMAPQMHQPPGTGVGANSTMVGAGWPRVSPAPASNVAAGPSMVGGQMAPLLIRRMQSQSSAASLPGVVTVPAFAQPLEVRSQMAGTKISMAQVQSPPATMTTPATTPRIVASRPATSEHHAEVGGGQPGDEALHREVDALRHAVAQQQEKIALLTQEVQTSHQNGARLSSEVETASQELVQLLEEVQVERAARERAEALLAEQQQAQLISPAARRGQKDEVEPRLREFLEKGKCNLIFRQLNRGWYSFRRADEKGPQSNDRHVEISIINGKLMVKLEATTHDPGWNFGKPGPIEKFVAKHAEE